MHELFAEALKGAAGELGALAVRLIASRPDREDEALRPGPNAAQVIFAPLPGGEASFPEPQNEEPSLTSGAEDVAHQFFLALHNQDRRGALAWCDPDWRNDSSRSAALRETLDAAPPVSWAFLDLYGPEDWDGHSDLPWIQVEAVVTYEFAHGRFEGIPARFWVAQTRFGWRMWNIAWWPDSESQSSAESDVVDLAALFTGIEATQSFQGAQVIPCTRCPQKLSIPVASGRLRVKCPKCWTVQFFDS